MAGHGEIWVIDPDIMKTAVVFVQPRFKTFGHIPTPGLNHSELIHSLGGPYTQPNSPYQAFPFLLIPNPGVVSIFEKNEAVGTTPQDSRRCEAVNANHFFPWICMKSD